MSYSFYWTWNVQYLTVSCCNSLKISACFCLCLLYATFCVAYSSCWAIPINDPSKNTTQLLIEDILSSTTLLHSAHLLPINDVSIFSMSSCLQICTKYSKPSQNISGSWLAYWPNSISMYLYRSGDARLRSIAPLMRSEGPIYRFREYGHPTALIMRFMSNFRKQKRDSHRTSIKLLTFIEKLVWDIAFRRMTCRSASSYYKLYKLAVRYNVDVLKIN